MVALRWRWAARLLDVGAALLALAITAWAVHELVEGQSPFKPWALLAVPLLIVMGRFPLVLSNKAGDAVIAFEAAVLVYLLCMVSPAQALAVWALAMVLEHCFEQRPARVRAFNISLTVIGGGLFAAVVTQVDHPLDRASATELGVVLLACGLYFVYDMLLTATWLALDAGERLAAALSWRTLPLGLVCFVAVDTIGYLAVVLVRTAADWTLGLLVVPILTILLAVDAVSRARLSEQRLSALFAAAAQAPGWEDDATMEREIVLHAEAVLRHTTAEVRAAPAEHGELSRQMGSRSPVRHLVVRRAAHAQPFDDDDRRALEALIALGLAALDRHELTEQMTHLAGHDPLTGLANRRVFADHLDRALQPGAGAGVAVLFCDLDGFKAVNDRYGHQGGDALLAAAAQRLRRRLRYGDKLARLGGDEFAVLLVEPDGRQAALAVAAAIHEELALPFRVPGGDAQVGVSIGVAHATPGDSGTDVLRNADTAMYRAKAQGKGRTELFEPLMRVDVLHRLELEEQLRIAVRDGSIAVAFQPIVDLGTGRIDGFEALARWTHPTLGSIPPDTFIPIAERMGLIRLVDDHVMLTAHTLMVDLVARTGVPLSLSVNVAPSQVGDPRLLHRVASLVAAAPEVPLILELTEQSLLADDADTVAALRQLTDTGARLAVDDFGVGYSSIGYLHRLPVDRVKIDKSLVQDLASRRSYLLVQGVLAMASAMDLQVVVEGIEDVESAVVLRDLGCDRAQGYLFGRPVPLAAAEQMVRRGSVPGWDQVQARRAARGVRPSDPAHAAG